MHLNQVKLSRMLTTTTGSVRSNGALDSITAAAQTTVESQIWTAGVGGMAKVVSARRLERSAGTVMEATITVASTVFG